MQIEILVPSAADQRNHYRVVVTGEGGECDCPDYYWRNVISGETEHQCKHLRTARQLLLDGVPGPKRTRASAQA
jgi:hypothetical protein